MRIKTTLQSNFVAGLILVAPLLVTLFVLRTVGGWLGGVLLPVVRGTSLETLTANNLVAAQVLALVLFALAVTAIGFVAQRSAGRKLFGRTGQVVDFLPVFRTIYGTIRGMASSVTSRDSDFESVVYVEYPRDDVYRLGLLTGDSPDELEAIAGEPAQNVFIPGSPNPTQGLLNLVPESRVHESDMSVRAAVRFLMTTGMDSGRSPIELDEEELHAPPADGTADAPADAAESTDSSD
ncbi:DUF502 domain-containing protein [Halobacterium jilantaiense]|uniref:Uncharacterized membrane protein n=1 Tax=Halobacterium jilantaiense TaxID=355548 RepID=A0A1I0N1M3_9EURY|nr:DUF502 domain-containing protein [Halobacterium jilantaiense]SEV94513.1 Uncharacterized membrane protein [Halobacterium jilantaiense]